MMGYQPEQRQSYGQFNQSQGGQRFQGQQMGLGTPMQDSMGGMGQMGQPQGFAQGQAPEQGRSRQRPTVDPESKIAYLQKKQEEINARDGTNYKIDQGEFDAIRNGTPRGQQMSAATQLQDQQQMGGGNQPGSMMGKFSGRGWKR